MTGLSPALPDRRILVPAIGITQMLAWGSSFYLLGVLANPIVRDTGWSYDWVISGVSLGLLVAGLVSPRIGHAIGQYGGRPVLAAGSLAFAAGFVVLGVASNLAVYLGAWVLMGVGMGAGLYDAAFSTLGQIYGTDARRPITLVTLFGGFASTVYWPLSAVLVEQLGWRGACFAYAAIHAGAALPILLMTVPRRRPTADDGANDRKRPTHVARSELAPFVLLATVLTLSSAILSIMGVHLLPLLQARGLDLASAVVLGSLLGPSQVAARVIEVFGARYYHPIWTMLISSIFVALGIGLLLAGWNIYALAVILFGVGNGISSVARGTLPLALFGSERYPALMGRLALPILAAMALAPLLGALLLQHGGADLTLGLITAVATANVVLVGLLWPVSHDLRAPTP
jgi:predicted MFS family arabinose efflux permease